MAQNWRTSPARSEEHCASMDGTIYLSFVFFGNVIANPALATMLLPTFPLAVLMTYSTGMVSNDNRRVKRIVKPPPPHHPNEWLMAPALEARM
jgi:hypothetical protein